VTLGGRAEKDANEIPIPQRHPRDRDLPGGRWVALCSRLQWRGRRLQDPNRVYRVAWGPRRLLLACHQRSWRGRGQAEVPATAMDLALDIVESHPASPCKADTDCSVMKVVCTEDDDCEWSHKLRECNGRGLHHHSVPAVCGGRTCAWLY